ncbi:MAG: aspartate aminotransferase family protein [Candidatus Methylacidiphilales bacterium]
MRPALVTEVPGPRSRQLAGDLRRYESRNLTYVSDGFPIFWERAEGANIWDVDGNRFLDLNGGFGVATAGFGSAHVVETFRHQAGDLYHGMGDVHPSRLKVELCRALSRVTFERWGVGEGKCILGCAGFEAVEAALKTAFLATGRPRVLAFDGGYHGLGYGAMSVTGMPEFRKPFLDQLRTFVNFLPFQDARRGRAVAEVRSEMDALLSQQQIGAILVEPIQGRGGEKFPQEGFLAMLREMADVHGCLLIFDEIYTGFFRTGDWFACDHWGVVPDLVCLGKGLTGSYPLSACVGQAKWMDAWPETQGEALHTSTFLGSPMGCALALASLRFWSDPERPHEVDRVSDFFACALEPLRSLPGVEEVRGKGLLWAVELTQHSAASSLVEPALRQGLILLPAGDEGRVISIKPGLCHTEDDAHYAGKILADLISTRC